MASPKPAIAILLVLIALALSNRVHSAEATCAAPAPSLSDPATTPPGTSLAITGPFADDAHLRTWVHAVIFQANDVPWWRDGFSYEGLRLLTKAQRSAGTAMALEYAQCEYADYIIGRAWDLAEMLDDLEQRQVRRHLRALAEQAMDAEHVRVIRHHHIGQEDDLPEQFDVMATWCHTAVRVRYYEEICDIGCLEFLTVFAKVFPDAERWRRSYYSCVPPSPECDKPLSYRLDLHDAIDHWLRDHPEGKSYWLQRRLESLHQRILNDVGRFRRFSDSTWEQLDLAASERAVADLLAEFPDEMADRRGVCADPPAPPASATAAAPAIPSAHPVAMPPPSQPGR
jgi:hypothetical protein